MNRNQAIQFVFSNLKQEEESCIGTQWASLYFVLIVSGFAFVGANNLIDNKTFFRLIGLLALGSLLLTICFSIKKTLLKKWIICAINFFLGIIAMDLLAIISFVEAAPKTGNPFRMVYLLIFVCAQAVLSVAVGLFLIHTNLKKYCQNTVKPINPTSRIIGGAGISGYFIAKIIEGTVEQDVLHIILEMLLLFLCVCMALPCTLCFHKAYLVKKYNITNADIEVLSDETVPIDFESEN